MRKTSLSLLVTLALAAPHAVALEGVPPEERREKQQNQSDKKNPAVFELGAKERDLLWEPWHKEICKELGKRMDKYVSTLIKVGKLRLGFSTMGIGNGMISAEVIVSDKRELTIKVLEKAGSPRLAKALDDVARDLNGSPILSFPNESRRHKVGFNFTYKRGKFPESTMHWIKDDVESVDSEEDAAK